ncbi:DUF3293 domain-containing protein [Dyella japonica]|uniref:DUF3293 domain-containing protein n=1 Tax=Dyella japonica A8 TaxID=1217721 RepID=A0A075K1I9_9GAMM|nr:DUF3293 domain-containing protein [Dyella japonica]AIF47685.1 hypothetical protein HY57_10630 [Dyella japonica A8]
MDEALLAAYRATDYRVRLARGGWATIRIDQPLPPALGALAEDHPWGFITAWNPRSEPSPRPRNRAALRDLLIALRVLPETVAIRPARGVGSDGQWKEPSLWVVGPDVSTLDPLARRFRQIGYVHGQGAAPARLRLVSLA